MVTTSVGVQGLAGAEFLPHADAPAVLADNICRLLEDDAHWCATSRAGTEFIEAEYSQAALWRVLDAQLAKASGRTARAA